MKAQVREHELVLADLRMGAEPDYSFRFAVARKEAGGWKEIPPRQLQWPWEAGRRLGAMWHRIWNEPADDVAGLNARGNAPRVSASVSSD